MKRSLLPLLLLWTGVANAAPAECACRAGMCGCGIAGNAACYVPVTARVNSATNPRSPPARMC